MLERRDLVRARLEAWMSRRSLLSKMPWAGRRRRNVLVRLRAAGIACNSEGGRVETEDDLDCLCVLRGLQPNEDRWRELIRLLPFRLSPDDEETISTKATAKWSLAAFAREHPRVLQVCAEEVERRGGRVRLALLDVLDRRYMLRSGTPPTASFEKSPIHFLGEVDDLGEDLSPMNRWGPTRIPPPRRLHRVVPSSGQRTWCPPRHRSVV